MSILINIEHKVIDIANNSSNDITILKKNIEDYFKNINEKELVNINKKEKYINNYENKRIAENIQYNNYLSDKSELYKLFQTEKTKISLYNYLNLKCPIKNNIPSLYSYEDIQLIDRVIIPKIPQVNIKKGVKKNVKKDVKKDIKCPEGKELNPITGRCVNKCKDSEVRDIITGKCKKIVNKVDNTIKVVNVDDGNVNVIVATNPSVVKKEIKCPEGKEVNPITGRCVNKCKDGEVRDKITGKCKKVVKNVNDKVKTINVVATNEDVVKKEIKCPEGKEVNSITGRCVNKCKDGEARNINTGKCKKVIKK
jgi:hypothetical protein